MNVCFDLMRDSAHFPAGAKFLPLLSVQEQKRELDLVLHSSSFSNAPGLRRLLEYIADKVIQGRFAEIKEFTIASEVLGRSPDYDPRIDTTVRVQAHRLREKLKEYFEHEGAEDDIVIELPKGHYIPRFARRTDPGNGGANGSPREAAVDGSLQETASGHENISRSSVSRGHRLSLRIAIGVLGMLLFAAILFLARWVPGLALPIGRRALADVSSLSQPSAALSEIWSDFLARGNPPIVAYANSEFFVTQTADLLRLKGNDAAGMGSPAFGKQAVDLAENPRLFLQAGPVFLDDSYTGTGEVMAVYLLTQLFTHAGIPLRVEKSGLITSDDLRDHNLIFLGSTTVLPLLQGLSLNQDFVFVEPQQPPTLWRSRIVNLHPGPGEPSSYQVERDSKTGMLQTDFALISFLPGVIPGRKIVVLGGMTTLGTEGAAQLATSSSGANELLSWFKTRHQTPSAKLPAYFQAVVKVEIRKVEILRSYVVDARPITVTHPQN